jgi:integrase
MAHRRVNGEGTIYRRKDGRYAGAAYVLTPGGTRKRVQVYGKTWNEAHNKLAAALATAQKGMPVADRKAKLGDYLDYWLENFVKANQRPKTYEQYEGSVRLYLKSGLGKRAISDLTVPMVQAFLNNLLKDTGKIRTVQVVRTTLSAALTRAQREELVSRNVAQLVELPQYKPKEITPWTTAEASVFLEVSQAHPFYAAFQLLVLYGLRRGEMLGLRWRDIRFDEGEILIRQQVQRVGRELLVGPVKTDSGKRDLPLLGSVRGPLDAHRDAQSQRRAALGSKWRGAGDETELVFTTAKGTPIEPRNFNRSFWTVCQANGIRVIRPHHVRHSLGTRLKELGVPVKDAQAILGHASVLTTMEIYQHDDMASRTAALTKVENVFEKALDKENESTNNNRCCQSSCQRLTFVEIITSVISGGPGGVQISGSSPRSSR